MDLKMEIHQATSMEDLDDAGSAFVCRRMQIETLDCQLAKSLNEAHELRAQETRSGGRRTASTESAPDVDSLEDRLLSSRSTTYN